MSDRVVLIAGPSGAKSTFAGGLLHYSEKINGYAVSDTVEGNNTDYEDSLIEPMFSLGEYPAMTEDGYKAHYELTGKSFTKPGLTIDFIDLPGEGQQQALNRPNMVPLMERLREGTAPDEDTVIKKYENNLLQDFKRGRSPATGDDWETTFLYQFYNANKAIFLYNIHKITEQDDRELAYDQKAIEFANDRFTDVAVIPIAVDLLGYDPDDFDPGFVEKTLSTIIKPSLLRDEELINHLHKHITRGDDRTASSILNYVEGEPEVDFFSVSVPDKGAPGTPEDKLTSDGEGGFEVKGFDKVIEWLEA